MTPDVNKIGPNIFIDFSIIQKSDLTRLTTELDYLIAYGKKVYSWSKLLTPIEQARWCSLQVIPRSQEEKDKHIKIRELRDSGSSYEEIATELNIKHKDIGWYLSRDPKKEWTLMDYILDFYKKDSSVYPKVDAIIDPDKNVVERFSKIGIHGNVVERI